jgi:hypothetical protein
MILEEPMPKIDWNIFGSHHLARHRNNRPGTETLKQHGFVRYCLGALAALVLLLPGRASLAEWGAWESFGGILLEEPDCVSWGPGRLDCFARSTDQAMWHRWWDGGQWGAWESLGGALLEQPDCVSWGSDRIDCFARGTDQAMWHRWWDGWQWGGWETLGGILLEQPDCVSWGPNRLDCFARGTDRAMWHRWWG